MGNEEMEELDPILEVWDENEESQETEKGVLLGDPNNTSTFLSVEQIDRCRTTQLTPVPWGKTHKKKGKIWKYFGTYGHNENCDRHVELCGKIKWLCTICHKMFKENVAGEALIAL